MIQSLDDCESEHLRCNGGKLIVGHVDGPLVESDRRRREARHAFNPSTSESRFLCRGLPRWMRIGSLPLPSMNFVSTL